MMQVILARPRGFCAGAIRAIRIVDEALARNGQPVYVLHEIVHNRHVVEHLRWRGAWFVESLAEVPAGALTIFSAHGVSNAVVKEAARRNLRVIDVTCPLVTRVHLQAREFSRQGFDVIIIGHRGHPEVEGTRGQVEGPVYVLSNIGEVATLQVRHPDRLAYVTQTTLSVDDTLEVIEALKKRFSIRGPDLSNICYATQTRQNSVRRLAKSIDLLLVVGARNSSNSTRLREVGEQSGVSARLIEDAEDLDSAWFSPHTRVGITAGASAPEEMVQRVLERLRIYSPCIVREMTHEPELLPSARSLPWGFKALTPG
jgi:4-hydroxy-3-methylbut-2-enyl diphosphate reductase